MELKSSELKVDATSLMVTITKEIELSFGLNTNPRIDLSKSLRGDALSSRAFSPLQIETGLASLSWNNIGGTNNILVESEEHNGTRWVGSIRANGFDLTLIGAKDREISQIGCSLPDPDKELEGFMMIRAKDGEGAFYTSQLFSKRT